MPKFLYNLDLDFGQLKKARVEILDILSSPGPESGQEDKWVGRLAYSKASGSEGLYVYTNQHAWEKLSTSISDPLTLTSLKEALTDNSLSEDLKMAIVNIIEPDSEARAKEGASGTETRGVFARAIDLDGVKSELANKATKEEFNSLNNTVRGITDWVTSKQDFDALKSTVDKFLADNTDTTLDTIKEIVDTVKANKGALETLGNAHQAAQNQILLYSKEFMTQHQTDDEAEYSVSLDDLSTPVNDYTVQLYDTEGNMVFAGVKKDVGRFTVSTAESAQLVAVITAKKQVTQ